MAVTSGLLLKDQGTVILGEWGLRTHNPTVCGLAFMVLYTFLNWLNIFNQEILHEKPHFWLILEICNIA